MVYAAENEMDFPKEDIQLYLEEFELDKSKDGRIEKQEFYEFC
jgi:Ca2+-binding EF-hand superfamily protein